MRLFGVHKSSVCDHKAIKNNSPSSSCPSCWGEEIVKQLVECGGREDCEWKNFVALDGVGRQDRSQLPINDSRHGNYWHLNCQLRGSKREKLQVRLINVICGWNAAPVLAVWMLIGDRSNVIVDWSWMRVGMQSPLALWSRCREDYRSSFN